MDLNQRVLRVLRGEIDSLLHAINFIHTVVRGVNSGSHIPCGIRGVSTALFLLPPRLHLDAQRSEAKIIVK